MANKQDLEDRKLTLRLAAIIVVAGLAVLGLVLFFFIPGLVAAVEPGVGLKQSAMIAFGLTMAALVVLAISAGDGLLGELQYMIAAFGGFFLISWLMIAWIF